MRALSAGIPAFPQDDSVIVLNPWPQPDRAEEEDDESSRKGKALKPTAEAGEEADER